MAQSKDTTLDEIIYEHNSRLDSFHHSIREKGLTPDERLAVEDEIGTKTTQALNRHYYQKFLEIINAQYEYSLTDIERLEYQTKTEHPMISKTRLAEQVKLKLLTSEDK